MGNTAESLDNYNRALTLRQQVADSDPHDVNARDTVARAQKSIGDVYLKARDPLYAVAYYQEALRLVAARAASDPANAVVRERLAYSYGAIGDAYAALATGPRLARPEALRNWREAPGSVCKGADIVARHARRGYAIAAFARAPRLGCRGGWPRG